MTSLSLLAGMTIPIFIDMGLLNNCAACNDQKVETLIAVEPYRIYGPKFAYLFISIFSSHLGMQNGCEGLPSIILTSRGILVKMLITLELNGISKSKFAYEGCSNMNASSFITFFTYMLRQNGKSFYKGLYVTFKLAPDLKKNTVYRVIAL